VGLTYTCNIRANLIDEDSVCSLKNSNCIGVNWSIESGSEFLRNQVLKRQMSREQILESGRLLNKYEIPHRIGNIIGLPGEKFEEMLETIQLNIDAHPNLGLANIFVPFPGLELTKYAIEGNYLSEEAMKNLPKNFFTRSPLNITPDENNRIQKLMCLFPIFVKYPALFHNAKIFRTLFHLPTLLLRVVYELYSSFNLSRLYNVKASYFAKLIIILRYLKNL
jgi:radical SAM superfamily enzyme YgiQ (UPF0313 family)